MIKIIFKKSPPGKVVETGGRYLKTAGITAAKIKNVKAVRRTTAGVKKGAHLGQKAGHVIAIPFIPVRFAKAGIGKVYMALRKVAIWIFVALFVIILLFVGMQIR